MPGVCGAYVDLNQGAISSAWGVWAVGQAVSHDGCALRGAVADAFLTFLEKGYVYRGLKPVYWCMVDRTALAEAEVEYEDHTSHSIWVKFPVCRRSRKNSDRCERADLDHDSLDFARQSCAGISSEF